MTDADLQNLVGNAVNRLCRAESLPTHFAGKPITYRIPYSMHGEQLVDLGTLPTSVQFPEATFLHNVDKPFEIHRMVPRITCMSHDDQANTDSVIYPQPQIGSGLERAVRLNIQDNSNNENLTKVSDTIENLTPNNSRVWEWKDPYTIIRSQGFQILINVGLLTATLAQIISTCVEGTPGCTAITIDKLRIDIDFQGYLIVVAPPSENR